MILEKAGSSAKTSTSNAIKSMTQVSRTSENDSKTTSGIQQHRVHPLPVECVYRGEGNANLVFALPYEHKVIRFRKSDPGESSPDGGFSRVKRERDFIKVVLSSFLRPYLDVPEILRYDRTELAKFSETIRSLRPEHRRFKEVVDAFATKFPDYAFLPEFLNCKEEVPGRSKSTFCVEIKPKQGFLCKADQKFRKCSYCLTQYYKLQKGTISSRSNYCPLDLFSGESDRMRRALKSLLEDPQNNLKIFKDGVVVFDQDSETNDLKSVFREWFPGATETAGSNLADKHFDLFFALVREALLREFPNEGQDTRDSGRSPMSFEISPDIEVPSRLSPEIVAKTKKLLYFTNEECDLTSTDLPQGSVLERILEIQRLHCHGADVIYWIFSKFSPILDNEIIYSSLIDIYESRENIPHWTHLAKSIKSLLISDQYHSVKEDINEKEVEIFIDDPIVIQNHRNSSKQKIRESLTAEDKNIIGNFPIEEQLAALENYLLFRTARDCSILIAFQEINQNESERVPETSLIEISKNLKFAVSVRISDLDPKSVHSIEKHRRRDLETLNAVIHIIEDELSHRNQNRVENSSL
ncbi:inositol-pentakisphosphate 2-kinase [Belonocnema kinseyi]|uniref:inositol-pentakisphosphate 2-kinase n=1 Tax=Belonocnema kinseyi TaxID=2817044 RepID=UPI00143D6765|nr:inositol-pentakisphosphate 2-kinase [Belonocnema kinseyi]XP_033220857.1 inositol-pentakisphosphate 2-kinase [Belonocnema kinseyi]XP_033220859.1 inositol-pentakisphosphate 2-kinase [Belonocnema kinseyi]XP_033220860.1 inositol-pentakisphosphate 2-kinase [Belonocnema kinseyi]